MSLDMKAHYESSEKNLYKNTIIVEQEIHSAWEASIFKFLKNSLKPVAIFGEFSFIILIKNFIFTLLYFYTLLFRGDVFNSYNLLIWLFSLIILTIYSWFQYRYNNIFHRMGINPNSKEKEDIKKIFTIFETLTNNHYSNRNYSFEELSKRIVEDSFFASSPVIDMYREIMLQISENYNLKLDNKKEEEIKNKLSEKIKKLIPSSDLIDNETKDTLLLNALQGMNKKHKRK